MIARYKRWVLRMAAADTGPGRLQTMRVVSMTLFLPLMLLVGLDYVVQPSGTIRDVLLFGFGGVSFALFLWSSYLVMTVQARYGSGSRTIVPSSEYHPGR